jgi:hypothetical protein
MDEQKERLQAQTMRRFYFCCIWQGAKRMTRDFMALGEFFIFCTVLFAILATIYPERSDTWLDVRPLYKMAYVFLVPVALGGFLYWLGRVPGGRKMYDNLVRSAIVDYSHTAPVPIRRKELDNGQLAITFSGLPVETWMDENNRPGIEAALNMYILDIRQEARQKEVTVIGVPASRVMETVIPWDASYQQQGTRIALGMSVAGLVTADFSKTYHWLIAGTTGMGKTTLVKLVIQQLLDAGAEVTIADWKHGVDFSDSSLRNRCSFVFDMETLLVMLDALLAELSARLELLQESGCTNLIEYNDQMGRNMTRKFLVLDETSMVLDTVGLSSAEKKDVEKVIAKLNTIARLGRAPGG